VTASDDSVDEVLGGLVDARRPTTGRDETDVEVVDVSHEVLVRGWPRLRGWIDAERQDLVVHRPSLMQQPNGRAWDALTLMRLGITGKLATTQGRRVPRGAAEHDRARRRRRLAQGAREHRRGR
jgi:hypothetical protein